MNIKLLHISLKMIIAGIITLFVAYLIKITNYTTAAAIAILSIQWTKRDFISIAIKRMISGILGFVVAALMFNYLGQYFLVFSIFLVIFILGSWYFGVPEGIVPTIVLVSHLFLIKEITLAFVFEEILLLTIALVIAFIVNMLYPQHTSKEMENNLYLVDGIIEQKIIYLKNKLRNVSLNDETHNSKKELEGIMTNSKMIDRDLVLQNDHRYITYLYMRDMQLNSLENISKNINRIEFDHPYKELVAEFLEDLSKNIGFSNQAMYIIENLNSLKEFFMGSELPKTRKEFEVRAILFQIVNELETFLNLKIEFHEKYPNFIEMEI